MLLLTMASCAGLKRPGKVLQFWAFCRLAKGPIMKQQQAAMSVGELRKAEQAGEGVATLGLLLSP